MKSVGAFEAKTHLSALLDQVERGEAVVITRRGKPVAQLAPMPDAAVDEKQRRKLEAIEKLKTFSDGRRLDGLKIKDLIEEGRR